MKIRLPNIKFVESMASQRFCVFMGFLCAARWDETLWHQSVSAYDGVPNSFHRCTIARLQKTRQTL